MKIYEDKDVGLKVVGNDNGKVSHAYYLNGVWAINMENVVKKVGDRTEDVFKYLVELWKDGFGICSRCGVILPRPDIAGSHFAGHYCEQCWLEYKKQNSRVCSICRQPLYMCCC